MYSDPPWSGSYSLCTSGGAFRVNTSAPRGAAAPAPIARNTERDDHPLGSVPHQIRGFLSNFENLSVTGKSYSSCSACSDKIVSAYREHGWDFVRKALNEHGYVEELSGLREVSR